MDFEKIMEPYYNVKDKIKQNVLNDTKEKNEKTAILKGMQERYANIEEDIDNYLNTYVDDNIVKRSVARKELIE